MREIKFRAWDKNEKEMIYQGIEFQLRCLGIKGNPKQKDFIGFGDWYTSRFEIMQFTGLHDNNNKEIYEGDIVKAEWRKDLYEVVFADGGFMLNILPDAHSQIFIQNEKVEIIGNVHENPELSGG